MNGLLVIIAALVPSAAPGPAWERRADGVVVSAQGVHVRLRVCSERILRVTAWPEGAPEPTRPSLAVVARWTPARFDVRAEDQALVLSTSQLGARVDLGSARISLADAAGRALLAEPVTGGKTFQPAAGQGEPAWEVSQHFEAPEDEGLYGLGQHQDRLLDLRGRDLDLWQHNREIVVPMLLGRRGWGLLWDNPSHMRFGFPEDVVPVPPPNLLDEAGRGGALTATYFADREMREPLGPAGRGYPSAASLPADVAAKVRAARWTGALLPEATGEYGLYSHRALNDVRLWLDNSLLINYWSLFVRADEAARLPLLAGRRYRLKIEWRRGDASGPFDLRWLPPRPAGRPTRLWSASAEGIDYYFIQGGSLDGVIAGYREATGRAPLLPRWAYGYWQSRERYRSQAELLEVVRQFRQRRFPLDVIVQDWRYWRDKQWGSHEFDPERFPDPKGMVDEAHRLDARVAISLWPKFDRGTTNFEQMSKAGLLYPYTLDRGIRDWLGDEFAFYDAFNPEARRLYWRQVRDALFAKGFDGWWLDADEPNLVDDPTPEEQARIIDPTALGPGARVLNAYPLVHNGGLYDELRQAAPDRRVAILSRSAWAGTQRHGAIAWSGDTAGRWEVLRAQVPAGLSYSLSGLPYWTHDIGGFSVDYPGGNKNEEYRELFARWFQFGAFCPIFRAHGQTTEREPWFFGGEDHPAYRTLVRFAGLRYRLLPYIYSLAARVTFEHDTMMRALVMDFPDDPQASQVDDQFLFGPALLVSPVFAPGARSRPVYLPAGRWYDFWTGAAVDGGRTVESPAPYESLPVHVRAGSIVPFGPTRQHAFDGPDDPVALFVYEGRDGAFALYEDDGLTSAYESGAWARIPIAWREADRTLTLGPRTGRFPGSPAERTFAITFVGPGRGVGYGGGPGRMVRYDGRPVAVRP